MGVGDRHSVPVSRPQLYEWRRIIVYRCTLRADRKAMGRQPLPRGRRRLCRSTCIGIKHLVVGGGAVCPEVVGDSSLVQISTLTPV